MITYQSFLVNPIARDRSLAMASRRCRLMVDGRGVGRPRDGHRFFKLKTFV
jgi:hypothetical protein